MPDEKLFTRGFWAMMPITTGVIPFGIVMGTVTSEAGLSFLQSTVMNIWVFAGAAQLAAVDLMSHHAAVPVVVVTGLIINLRFLLYSAALVPVVQESSLLTRLLCAYWITDQNYAVMSAHFNELKTPAQAVRFYLGASVAMCLVWHLSVVVGYVFGNIAPASWALDYAVPVSFVALLVPTMKNRKYVAVAAFSALTALLLHFLPFRMGLILTSLLSISLATLLIRRKETA